MTDPATDGAASDQPAKPAPKWHRFVRRFKDWEAAFLTQLEKKGSVKAAALAVGVAPRTVYYRREKSPRFAAAWDEIVNTVNERLEAAVYERALHGVERTKFYKDVPIATEREYSDGLAQFLLEKRIPERYGRNAGGGDDDETPAKIVAAVAAMRGTVAASPEMAALKAEVDALRAELARLRPAASPTETKPPRTKKKPRRKKAS